MSVVGNQNLICVLSGTCYLPCKLYTGNHKKLLHNPRKALP